MRLIVTSMSKSLLTFSPLTDSIFTRIDKQIFSNNVKVLCDSSATKYFLVTMFVVQKDV